MDLRGRTALVTGASSGIGTRFAHELAGRGAHVILVARRQGRLDSLAGELRTNHAAGATVLAADLSVPGAAHDLHQRVTTTGLHVDVLINNAGFAQHGRFESADPLRIDEQLAVNIGAVVDLTRLFLPPMVAHGNGIVVNVASTAAYQPVPSMAVYAATKAFVLSFSESLWGEYEGTGVTVMALCPGATETEFFQVAGEAASVGRRQTPQDVVSTAMRALDRRTPRPSVVTGAANRLSTLLPRFVPRTTAIRATRRLVSDPAA